jgi:hypothetical protein
VYLKSKNHRYIFYAEVLNYSILNNDQRFTGSVFKYGSIIVFTSQGSEDSSLLREKKYHQLAGLCISPIFASRAISEMQNWFRGHIGNAYHVSPNRWIANMIKLLVIVGDLGDVP